MLQIPLPHRGLITISGKDRKTFFQGLITQDVFKVSSNQVLFSAFLTPQGRYLYDFFILENSEADTLYLEGDQAILGSLLQRLTAYKLRLDVTLETIRDYHSFALIGDNSQQASGFSPDALPGAARIEDSSFIFIDPRLPALGMRLLTRDFSPIPPWLQDIPQGTAQDYNKHRLKHGIPDSTQDLVPEKSILLENGFEEMNAISWNKGCYLGQELNARTHYRGLVRKRLLPCFIAGAPVAMGAPLLDPNGKEVGEMRSSQDEYGLAMIRLEAFFDGQDKEKKITPADGKTQVIPYLLPWMRLTAPFAA